MRLFWVENRMGLSSDGRRELKEKKGSDVGLRVLVGGLRDEGFRWRRR